MSINVTPAATTSIADQPVTRNQSFTWLNSYVRTHTDVLNFTRTFTRDNLGRLTQIMSTINP
ncbi:MAG: hypothetical protein FJ387_31140 [Verrucomicrobia bacterium]|nr:hypothetical protein [Verrucomicrobiota bacterium]